MGLGQGCNNSPWGPKRDIHNPQGPSLQPQLPGVPIPTVEEARSEKLPDLWHPQLTYGRDGIMGWSVTTPTPAPRKRCVEILPLVAQNVILFGNWFVAEVIS